jgi:hypothetical protein
MMAVNCNFICVKILESEKGRVEKRGCFKFKVVWIFLFHVWSGGRGWWGEDLNFMRELAD